MTLTIEQQFARAGIEYTDAMRHFFAGPHGTYATADAVVRIVVNHRPAAIFVGAELDRIDREERAKRRFRRTMRRLEKRARNMRLDATREHVRALRLDPHPDHARDMREMGAFARESGDDMGRRVGYILTRATDAVARYREALA